MCQIWKIKKYVNIYEYNPIESRVYYHSVIYDYLNILKISRINIFTCFVRKKTFG